MIRRTNAADFPMPEGVRHIFTDGGLIGRSPSLTGGMVAFCYADAGFRFLGGYAGVVMMADLPPGLSFVSCNLMETLAVILAFERVPDECRPVLWCDSANAIRAARGETATKYLPPCLRKRLAAAVQSRPKITTLVTGHPTKADLLVGKSARTGRPVHPMNVWCDAACAQALQLCRAGKGHGFYYRTEETTEPCPIPKDPTETPASQRPETASTGR